MNAKEIKKTHQTVLELDVKIKNLQARKKKLLEPVRAELDKLYVDGTNVLAAFGEERFKLCECMRSDSKYIQEHAPEVYEASKVTTYRMNTVKAGVKAV